VNDRGFLNWLEAQVRGTAGCRHCRRRNGVRGADLAILTNAQAFELTGVEFIDENGGGRGVRLRNRQRSRQPK
jgi:hypothetical protein